MMHRTFRAHRGVVAIGLAACLVLLTACGDEEIQTAASSTTSTRGASVARPTLEGPVSGGLGKPFLGTTTFDLAQVGYAEAEYFMSGTATAYTRAGALSADGRWNVAPSDTATYKTRVLVYRPTDAKKFNGTVWVEWLNVSGGVDAGADWIMAHVELIREGAAWMGVSAQRVGVEGGKGLLGTETMALKTTDPARYGTLVHPGDSFSYDIFSQAAQAIRRPNRVNPLGALRPTTVIAAGESQSAFRMVTYINAVHPLADIYDGFLVHSRGGNSVGVAPLAEAPQAAIPVPAATLTRTDLNVPVMTFETETDLTFLGYSRVEQDDSSGVRVWEVAGTAHADTYTTVVGMTDLGNDPDAASLVLTTEPVPGMGTCAAPINSGPQHFVLNAAVAALQRWVTDGTPPPSAPRLQVSGSALVRDAHGNAVGGIRTPQLDAPIATFSGETQPGPIFCLLFGATTPFDATTLSALYSNHAAYVSAFDTATDQALQAGFILAPDAALLKANAAASDIGM